MRLSLTSEEFALLTKVLHTAQAEREQGVVQSQSVENRQVLEHEIEELQALRRRLTELHREEIVDESSEESFPASDPPARSVAREGRG
jgi:thiamine kinase-like enzyme